MIEKEAFIAALLPICDTVCEYDRAWGKLRVRKTSLASGLEDKWYTVEELRDIFRDNGGVLAEKSVWMRYLSSENLRSFFYEKERNESFRLRFRQGGVGCRQYDIHIDRINDKVLVISGRDTQEQEIDALTGALSRNHYQRDMSNEVYRGGVALIDMDDLKLYNDMNGHQVGDNALRALADTIYEVVGRSGSLVRYGGDEFLLLLPGVEQAAFTTVLGDIQRRLAAVMMQQLRRQEHMMGIVADILSRVMGYRNGEGADHGRHVEQITQRLLQRMLERTDKYGLTLQDCRRAAAAAMFHDIGKMGVPDALLRKPGPLTPEEFDEIKKHTLIGEELMRGMKEMESEPLVETAAEICRWHHERVDGRGYPDGLKGNEIPMTVQAVGLADAYDALVSQRVYKPAYTHAEALAMIRGGECGAFDPLLVDCLEDIQGALCREVYGMRGKE